MECKYPQALIDEAHDLAFRGELSNKEIAAKLNLDANQLDYILYRLKESDHWVRDMKKTMEKPKSTRLSRFLDFFISKEYR
jgi:transcription initiation factor IIE alpha subunit